MFDEQCWSTEIVYFFQAKLLTVDQFLSFKEDFIENEGKRYSKSLRKNKKQLRKKLMLFEQRLDDSIHATKTCQCCGYLPANAALQQELYFESYQDEIQRINEDFKLTSELAEILEFNMNNGFRATWEFDLQQGKPNEEKIAQTINLNTWKLVYSESPNWDDWEQDLRKSLIKDVNEKKASARAKSMNSSDSPKNPLYPIRKRLASR